MSFNSKSFSFDMTAFLIPVPVIIKGRLYVSNISVNIRIAWEDLSGDDFLVDRLQAPHLLGRSSRYCVREKCR